jgi:hypothetical protein
MSLRLDDRDAQPDSDLPDDPTEPIDMDPSDRLDEIAGILARGILRLHGRVLPEYAPTGEHPDCPPFGLELSAPSRPDGLAG